MKVLLLSSCGPLNENYEYENAFFIIKMSFGILLISIYYEGEGAPLLV